MTAQRTIRVVVEIKVRGACTEDDLRREVERIVLGKLSLPEKAKLAPRSVMIKSFAKLTAAERRAHSAHQKITELQALIVDIDDRVGKLEEKPQ